MPLTSLFAFLMHVEITLPLEENSFFTYLSSPLGKREKAIQNIARENKKHHTTSKIFIRLPIPAHRQVT